MSKTYRIALHYKAEKYIHFQNKIEIQCDAFEKIPV